MKTHKHATARKLLPVTALLAMMVAIPAAAFAAEETKSGSAPSGAEVERINVESIKEKYWARGDESELGVVQNRTYSKENKFEFGLNGGILSSDPFLTVRSTGFSFGYHFSEYLSARFIGWKSFATGSSALTTFQEVMHAETNYNKPQAYYGGEGSFAFIYGKLSLVGKAIIYYDMHLATGLGMTRTESGTYFTPSFGLGQKIFLNQNFSIRADYRAMIYREEIIEKIVTPLLGTSRGYRTNWTHAVTIGVDFLFGVLK